MRKKGMIAAAAGVLALAAGLVLLLARLGSPGAAPRYAVVYEKGSQNLFAALPQGSFPLRARGSQQQLFAGQYLYYDAVTDDGVDLYRMDLRDSRSRKEGGSLLARGAREEWTVSADGRYAVWIEARGNVLQCHEAQRGGVTELAAGVDALYAAPGQDAFFFTKGEGELFRCNLKLGQRPERMASGARDVRFFGAAPKPQAVVYYLLPSGETFDLYALAQEGGAVLVAQAPVRVLFESYTSGGNLYFLKGGEGAAGGLAVDDPQAESDAAMRQPQKPPGGGGPLTSWLGDVLGVNEAYKREKAAWDKKVERDKVRDALREALEAMPENELPLDCYVYDGANARLLARGVREDHIGLLRPLGRPAMLYEKQRAGGEDANGVTISLDTMVAAYRAGGVSAMREALYTLAGEGGESAGYALAMMAPAGPSEVPLGLDFGGGAGWKAVFLPGSETMLYQERDVEGGLYALYAYELTEYGLSERRVADLGVDDVTVVPSGAYYRKRVADAKGSALYFYAPDGRAGRVMQNAGAFLPAGDALLAFDGADALYYVQGLEARRLAGGVRPEGVRAGASHVCFLAAWEAGAGELRLFDLNDRGKNAAAKALDTGVTAIRVVK